MNALASPLRSLLLASSALGITACQTAGPPTPLRVGLGTMPTSLVALAKEADPGAALELGVDRDGALSTLAVTIPNDRLPAAVTSAVRRLAPGSDLLAAVQRSTPLGPEFAVDVQKDGVAWNFVVTPDGNLLASEREIDAVDVPDAVLRSADRTLTGGERIGTREVRRGEQVGYRIRHRDGARIEEADFALDGTVLRAVRRTPAVVEMPIAHE